jgi:hypothetical protein
MDFAAKWDYYLRMKFLPTALLLALVLLVPSPAARAQSAQQTPVRNAFGQLVQPTPAQSLRTQSAQQVLSMAQTAYLRGDLESAKKGFEAVYSLDPHNVVAANYLRMIKVSEANAPKGNDLEKQLETVILPKVEFKEATLNSALDYLRQAVDKASGGKTSVNFVVGLPDDQKNAPITLSLSKVPFTDVVRYIGELANVKFGYDKYAISVRPGNGPAPAPVTAPSTVAPAIPGLNP